MKVTSRIVAVVAALIMVTALITGCGGKSESNENKSPFVGKWICTDMEESWGAKRHYEDSGFKLDIRDDGSFTYTVHQNKQEGTWKERGSSSARLTIDGEDQDVSIEDDKLVMKTNTTTYFYEKDE